MDYMRDIFNKSIPRFGYVIEKDNGIDVVVILGVSDVEKIGKYCINNSCNSCQGNSRSNSYHSRR